MRKMAPSHRHEPAPDAQLVAADLIVRYTNRTNQQKEKKMTIKSPMHQRIRDWLRQSDAEFEGRAKKEAEQPNRGIPQMSSKSSHSMSGAFTNATRSRWACFSMQST
jgi:hypothetical protein